jgi:hypothetical protein
MGQPHVPQYRKTTAKLLFTDCQLMTELFKRGRCMLPYRLNYLALQCGKTFTFGSRRPTGNIDGPGITGFNNGHFIDVAILTKHPVQMQYALVDPQLRTASAAHFIGNVRHLTLPFSIL